jgi:hypothetical protein
MASNNGYFFASVIKPSLNDGFQLLLFFTSSRTELTWLPQLSSCNPSARPSQTTPSVHLRISVAAETCLPSHSQAATVCSCLLRIWCLVTDVPLSVSRPLSRNECCFRAVP